MASEELQEELEALTCAELVRKLCILFNSDQEDEVDECLDWFLFTYSPEHAFPLVQNNADAFRDGTFLNITMTKVKEIYEPEIFLESLNIVSCLEGYEQDIAKAGAVKATIMMMGKDIHNPRSQLLGSKVLANLAHDLEVCKWVGKVKGISRLLETLKRHTEAPEVVIEVCRTLANLAFRCKSNKELMISSTAIELILSAIAFDKLNEKLVNAGLRAIRNIVSECKDTHLEETVLKQVVEAMTEFPQAYDIQNNGIWILVNLMSGKVDFKKTVIESGAIDHVLTGMQTHESDPHVQLAGSTALALLSKIAVYRPVIGKKGAIQVLSVALRGHRAIVPIQRAVMKALFRLSFNETNRNKIAELRIVFEILESMKINTSSGPLQRIAILCLMQFSKNGKMKDIIQTKAVPLVVQARNRFSDIAHIYKVANAAVEAIVSSSNNPSLIQTANNLPAAISSTPAAVPGAAATAAAAAAATTTSASTNTKPLSSPSSSPSTSSSLTTEDDSFLSELKGLQLKIAEKVDMEGKIRSQIGDLEGSVGRLKGGSAVPVELSPVVEEKISLKKEVAKLKAQRTNSVKEFRKAQSELQEIMAYLEAHSKEDEKAKKKYLGSSGEIKKDKTGEKKDTLATGEKKKTIGKHAKKSGVKGEKKGISSGPKQPKNRLNSVPGKIKLTNSGSGEKLPEPSDLLDSANDDLDEESKDIVSSVLPQQQNSLRTINRKLSVSVSSAVMSPEEIAAINKQIEDLKKLLSDKEKELEISLSRKNETEAQVIKMETEFKGTDILIQTLQKESLTQTHNREKMVTGNSFFTKHQKKLKSIKDEIQVLTAENDELKKEIMTLTSEGGGTPTASPLPATLSTLTTSNSTLTNAPGNPDNGTKKNKKNKH